MAGSLLDRITGELHEQTFGDLGDPVTYLVGGVTERDVNAFVDALERVSDFGQSSSNAADLLIEFRVVDVPARPNKIDRIVVHASGKTYQPLSAILIEEGRLWQVEAKAL